MGKIMTKIMTEIITLKQGLNLWIKQRQNIYMTKVKTKIMTKNKIKRIFCIKDKIIAEVATSITPKITIISEIITKWILNYD